MYFSLATACLGSKRSDFSTSASTSNEA